LEDKTLSGLFVIYIIDFANPVHAFKFLKLEARAFTLALYMMGCGRECAGFRPFFDGWYEGLSDPVL